MAVPDYQTLMLPLLEAMEDEQVRRLVPDVTNALAARFRLTREDLGQLLPSGTQTTFVNRCHWAATYMTKAGLLERPRRGHVAVTKRGLDLLASRPGRVDIAVLSRYSEFEAFRARRSSERDTRKPDEAENPEESLPRAYGSWRQTVEVELLERLQSDAFPWQAFERLVVDLLHAMGYGGTDEDLREVTRMTGDEGIDGVIKEDRLGLDAVSIQAKNYGPRTKVGRPALQAFAGSLAGQRASKGVFITTSSFSPEAVEYVGRIPQRIVLIDGPTLARYMYDHGIGVRHRRSLDVKGVDDAYFEGRRVTRVTEAASSR
jgi:restriction system protein